MTARSIALFIAAAVAEIGGAYLVWVSVKDHKGIVFLALGAMALTLYGVVAAATGGGRIAARTGSPVK